MITFSDVSTSNYNIVQFLAHGDGEGDTVKVNLSTPPFNINFNGIVPTDGIVTALEEGVTATAVIEPDENNNNILTMTFSETLATDNPTVCQVSFRYPTLP